MAEFDRRTYILIFVAFVAFAAKELWQPAEEQPTKDVHKDIPVTKLGTGTSTFMGPTLRFAYCHSCGYRKAFEQYAAILQEKYPQLNVQGDVHPPPPFRMLLAQILGVAKLLLIAAVLAGINPFERLGMQTPSWWQWCNENKVYACMMAFLLSNMLEGQLVSSGAFEIYFNDVPVWSKIETGRIPNPQELFQIIDNNVQLQAEIVPEAILM